MAELIQVDATHGRRALPRILAIMGSGETAPAMARVHRMLFERFPAAAEPAVVLDTPYGFQENADALGERTVEFYATSVGRAVSLVSISAAVQALLELDTAVAARQRSGEDSLDLDAAWGTLRSLIVRLGEVAQAGVGDPRATLDAFVSTLLDIRARARAARDWETADLVRTRLTGAGVEVRDDQDASSWILRERVAS